MPLYRDGSVTLTLGQREVVGHRTSFSTEAAPGDIIILDGSFTCYEIQSIEADTALTLDVPAKETVSEAGYVIIRSISTANNLYLMRKIDEFLKDRQVSLVEFRDWMHGTVDGGPEGDGRYPLTDRYGETTLVPSPTAMQTGLTETIEEAEHILAGLEGLDDAVTSAQNSANLADSHRDAAAGSASAASSSEIAAKAAQTAAEGRATDAATSAAAAEAAKLAAQASESASASSETQAAISAAAAAASETAAQSSVDSASASMTAAAASEIAAASARDTTLSARDAAKASEDAAALSETAAHQSAQAAATSEDNAAASASAADLSASAADTSATSAESDRILAEEARTEAEASALAASVSETNAAASADAAALSAQEAADTVLGNVFDDVAVNELRGWTSQKISDELEAKVDKVPGKQLSTEDYTTSDRNKLATIQEGAQVNPVPVDNLTTPDSTVPLSAAQGRVLKGLIDGINTILQSDDTDLDELQEIVDYIKLNRADLDSLSISSIAGLADALANKQPLATVLTNTTASFTSSLLSKLNGIEPGAQVNTVTSVAGRTGAVSVNKEDVGLGNVDNTSDANKPVSTATQAALNLKANTASLGTAASHDVTTSTTDTTNGRVLKVGDFGVGSPTMLPAGTDLNTFTTNGSYDLQNAVNKPAGSANWGYLRVIRQNNTNGYCYQEWTELNNANPRTYYRVQNLGTWSEWRELYHTGNFNPANFLPLSGGTLAGHLIAWPRNSAMTQNDSSSSMEVRNGGGSGESGLAMLAFHCVDSYATKIGLRADGYFGLGGWSAAAWRWYVAPSGDMTAAGNVTAYSDPRLKDDVSVIKGALDIIQRLDGVRFTWNDKTRLVGSPGRRDIGVLADQVEAVLPEIVGRSIPDEDNDGISWSVVAYDKLTPVLIQAIKEQQVQIEEQQSEIQQMRDELTELRALIQKDK